MKTTELIKHFGSQVAAAEQIGVWQPCISKWLKRGSPPAIRQLQIEKLTGGKLKVDAEVRKQFGL